MTSLGLLAVLGAAALAGIGLIVVLLVRGDGELPDPTSLQAALPLTPTPLAQTGSDVDIVPSSRLISNNRTHLSLCVGGEDGTGASEADVEAVRVALEQGLAAQAEIPPEFSQREVTSGCPLPSVPLGDRASGVGEFGDNVDEPSEHLLFVYLIPPELYSSTFDSEPFVNGSAQFVCEYDQCTKATMALYLPSSATNEDIRQALLDTLRLLPREPIPDPTFDWEACERGTPPHPDYSCDQYDDIVE